MLSPQVVHEFPLQGQLQAPAMQSVRLHMSFRRCLGRQEHEHASRQWHTHTLMIDVGGEYVSSLSMSSAGSLDCSTMSRLGCRTKPCDEWPPSIPHLRSLLATHAQAIGVFGAQMPLPSYELERLSIHQEAVCMSVLSEYRLASLRKHKLHRDKQVGSTRELTDFATAKPRCRTRAERRGALPPARRGQRSPAGGQSNPAC